MYQQEWFAEKPCPSFATHHSLPGAYPYPHDSLSIIPYPRQFPPHHSLSTIPYPVNAEMPATIISNDISLWNCFHSVLEDLPKTNNACEGFHNGFASVLGAHHPTIYKLIDSLKDEQVLTELAMSQLAMEPNISVLQKCQTWPEFRKHFRNLFHK